MTVSNRNIRFQFKYSRGKKSADNITAAVYIRCCATGLIGFWKHTSMDLNSFPWLYQNNWWTIWRGRSWDLHRSSHPDFILFKVRFAGRCQSQCSRCFLHWGYAVEYSKLLRGNPMLYYFCLRFLGLAQLFVNTALLGALKVLARQDKLWSTFEAKAMLLIGGNTTLESPLSGEISQVEDMQIVFVDR